MLNGECLACLVNLPEEETPIVKTVVFSSYENDDTIDIDFEEKIDYRDCPIFPTW